MHAKRQDVVYVDDDDFYYDSWWHSPAGIAVRWALFALIIFTILGWFIIGYIHAQKRMKRGLPPLAYHRFLVPRSQRAQFDPRYMNPFPFYHPHYNSAGVGPDGYPMHNYPEPPPVYNTDVPPSYQPPPGATKADPQQGYGAPPAGGGTYEPAPSASGSIPPPTQSHQTGNTNPFRL